MLSHDNKLSKIKDNTTRKSEDLHCAAMCLCFALAVAGSMGTILKRCQSLESLKCISL